MQIRGHDLGVCSWSLRPASMADLVAQIQQLGLGHMQLDLAWLLAMEAAQRQTEVETLRASGIVLTAGMMHFAGENYKSIAIIRETGGFVPDEQWPERLALLKQAGPFASSLGIKGITVHVGFLPTSANEKYATMLQRAREVADAWAPLGIDVLMETGQETAPELLRFLNDLNCKNVKVNFDPANMILYGAGDPIAAVKTLGRHIGHVHVKDATMSDQPGVKWGAEVPFGTGQVKPSAFLAALNQAGYKGALAIEREAGESRLRDLGIAIEALKAVG